ncbi:MAG: hypothetical protein FWC92_08950 [Defluviitaleaceae bacterium]|nr:hypothetical protein [Defluviitaleaceae bacterium]
MLEHDELTHLHVQRVIKPKVEDVLPYFLDGEMMGTALSFVAYLRAVKMNPGWAGVHNAWRANNKNKPICYIRLGKEWIRDTKNVQWVIVLYLNHMDEYTEVIHSEGWQEIVWADLHYCRSCAYGCFPGRTKTILGKEFLGLCPTFYNKVSFVNPDEATIKIVTRLLDLEREARKCKGKQ